MLRVLWRWCGVAVCWLVGCAVLLPLIVACFRHICFAPSDLFLACLLLLLPLAAGCVVRVLGGLGLV